VFKIDTTERKFKDAVNNLLQMNAYTDTTSNIDQRKKFEELTVQYETEKKDKDIQLLKQQGDLQEAKLNQSHLARNITFAGAALLLIIAGLLYYLYHTKQKSNRQLTHLLHEKEWLLKEIHHRVKNNLQTVLSLLESQSRQLSNEAFNALRESQNRVYTMSLIHKKLYQSTDVSSISMEDYLRDLIQHLRDSFGASGNIRFSLEVDSVDLDVSQAVPVGLIVNEAITNSIKYAFPNNRHDNGVYISLKKSNENKVVLLIMDNGVGITAPKENTQTLGLKLMRGLTEDIEGTFSIESHHGVTVMIEFVANIPFERSANAIILNHQLTTRPNP
jgi:two-component sensor histidine kinase